MTDEQNATITAVFQAISAYDTDALKTLFAPDATATEPTRAVYHGPDGAEQLVNDLSRSYVDFIVKPKNAVVDNGAAAVEWNATVTDFGGGQSKVDGCSVINFAGDKIRRMRSYWRPEDMHS